MKGKKIRRIAIFIVGITFFLVAVIVKILPYLSVKKQENITEKEENEPKAFYEVGDEVKLRQKGDEEVYPFEVTVLKSAYEKEFLDEDNYYAERGKIRKQLEDKNKAYGGNNIFYESDYRYIIIDLKIKRLKLTSEESKLMKGEAAYNFQELRLHNLFDAAKLSDSLAFGCTDYRILSENEEEYTIISSPYSTKNSALLLEEGAEVTIQLVYLIPFGTEYTLYNPCLNLTWDDPDSTTVGDGSSIFLKYEFVSLGLEIYESEYPLTNNLEDSESRKKANVSIQSRTAAQAKAEKGLLNYEIAELEKQTGLSVQQDKIFSKEGTIYDGLNKGNSIDKSYTYTAFEDISSTLYDTMEELPEYFSNNKALKTIYQRYMEQGGYEKETLKILVVQCKYIYYADKLKGLTIHSLQPIWLYDKKDNGLFYPYGYTDVYHIINSQTEGNIADSPYLYLKNGESAIVEIAYIVPQDSYQELYITPSNRLLWQESINGSYITFNCVLDKERND